MTLNSFTSIDTTPDAGAVTREILTARSATQLVRRAIYFRTEEDRADQVAAFRRDLGTENVTYERL